MNGYNIYKLISTVRHGSRAAILSRKGFNYNRPRALELALGLRPRRTLRATRRTRTPWR